MESYMNINHEKQSFQQDAGVIERWEQVENKFFFYGLQSVLEVKVFSDIVIRFRFTALGNFERDFSYSHAYAYQGTIEQLEIDEQEAHFVIKTSKVNIEIQKERMLIRILDKKGLVISEDEKGYHWEEHKKNGGEIVFNTRKGQAGEHFYGLGDKPTDTDIRGKRFENWGKDTYAFGKDSDPLYKNVPFFIGLHHKVAYGIFFDNSFRTYFDFGFERQNATSFWAQGGEMNYYFIYGPELLSVVETYTNLTGKPELPPLWALGFHQCKWSYYPENQVREITSEFRERKIPCDAFYLDIDYMDGFRCFTWHPEHFPKPKKMIADLEKQGFKTVVIIDPGIKIDPNYWVYKEGLEKGYFCKRMDGPLMKGAVWPGECNFPDFTRAEVREWWAGLFGDLMDTGVRGVWNDMNEPAVFEIETFPNDVRHDYDGDPCSHRKAHNVYGMQMARATYEGVKKFGDNKRPFVITRSGYSGMQKYSSVWTGDNVASWEHLTIANNQCQRLSVSGVSYCGSDIGGFIGSPTGELFVRWIQLGIFHMFFRVHSSGDHGDQEPWSFGVEYELLTKKFIELRYQLLPYIYTTFYQHVSTGMPTIRPLPFVAQDDPETYARQDEFCLGENLLVCPILTEKVDGRWLYLPEGKWYYYWDDLEYDGKQEVWAEAALDRVPLFVKSGAVIPMAPVMQYVGEFNPEQLYLHAYVDESEYKSYLYEDKGDGYEYTNGQSSYKTFTTNGEKKSFIMTQEVEGNFETVYNSYEIMVHGLGFKPKSCEVDGASVSIDIINPDNNLIRFDAPKNFSKIIVKG
jgi:alpha-glucosidase